MKVDDGPKQNTDRLLWRKSDDAFSPSIHVTASGAIGINCGGTVIVMPIERWHALAAGAVFAAERDARDREGTPGTPERGSNPRANAKSYDVEGLHGVPTAVPSHSADSGISPKPLEGNAPGKT